MSEHDLLRILRQVTVAVTDFTNPTLYGALLESRGGMMTMVGVDSRRVAVRRHPVTDHAGDISVVIPHRALDVIDVMLRRFPLELVHVVQSSTGNALQVTIGPALLICLLQVGKFAAYERLLDVPYKTKVTVSRTGLAQTLRTASNFSLDGAHGVRLDFGNDSVLTASAAAPDVGATDGQVQIEIEGPPARTTLGTKIAMDVLTLMDTEFVELRLAGPLDPIAFRPVGVEDYLYVMNATTDTAWTSDAATTS
jgi:DNA polymerase III sliding clamp (beta) subunit (PCNA family)